MIRKWLSDRFDLMLNGYTADDLAAVAAKMSNPAPWKVIPVTKREMAALNGTSQLGVAKVRETSPKIADALFSGSLGSHDGINWIRCEPNKASQYPFRIEAGVATIPAEVGAIVGNLLSDR